MSSNDHGPPVDAASNPSLDMTAPHRAACVYTGGDASARLSGYLIDAVVIAAASFVLLVVLGLVHGPVIEFSGAGELADRVDVDRTRFAADTAVIVVFVGLYFAGSWARRGATIGQRSTGLSVLSASDGGPPSLGWALVRFIALGTPFWVAAGFVAGSARFLLWLIGALWYFALLVSVVRGSTTTGWHDRIARTIVVRKVSTVDVPQRPTSRGEA